MSNDNLQDRDDRYKVPPGNVEAEFIDKDQQILVNIPGITDLETLQIAEEEFLARAYEQLLSEVRIDTPMTVELLKHIHQTIFGQLFAWSGRWRTVQISKPGAVWPPPHFLEQAMASYELECLSKYPASKLTDDSLFCAAVGEIQGEFLAIHPFREGNARTIKLMTNLLALQSGRPLLAYDASENGSEHYISAAKAALIRKDYVPLTKLIAEALGRSR